MVRSVLCVCVCVCVCVFCLLLFFVLFCFYHIVAHALEESYIETEKSEQTVIAQISLS